MARAVHRSSDAHVAKLVLDPEARQLIDWDRSLPGFGRRMSGKTMARSWLVRRGGTVAGRGRYRIVEGNSES